MNIPEKHQRKIARRTMELTCLGSRILGGMTHVEAARILGVPLPEHCTCGMLAMIRESK